MTTTAVSPVPAVRLASPPSRSLALLIASGGAAAGVALFAMAFTSDSVEEPAALAALGSWITVPYIGAGLLAWRRRPESRLGALMVAAGFFTFLSFLSWSNDDRLYTLGLAADFLPPVLFLHVFLAFPSGRLETRLDRGVVLAAYAAAALSPVRLLLGAEPPHNVLAITDAPALEFAILGAQLLALSLLCLSGIAVLLVRRRRTGRPLRATLGLMVDAFALGLLMIALLLLAGLYEWGFADPIRLVTFAVMGIAPIVFLAGLLHARLARGSLADLVVELGVNPGPGALDGAVSRALRDPSATVAYWLPEFDSYADAEGHEVDPDADPGRSWTPVLRDGNAVAALLHDASLADERELLTSVAAAVGMAIENARLQVELRARIEEVRGSRVRILQAGQQERRRLERDLHDGAQQRLVALSLELSRLEASVGDDPDLRSRVAAASHEVAASLAELRDLARGLHPAIVTDHGLMVALESLTMRAPVPVELTGSLDTRLPEAVEIAAFFLVSESLANIGKHAQASTASIELTREPGWFRIAVVDDGVGGADAENGTGLRGLADRIEALGGRVRVVSPPGGGTRVTAEIPCEP